MKASEFLAKWFGISADKLVDGLRSIAAAGGDAGAFATMMLVNLDKQIDPAHISAVILALPSEVRDIVTGHLNGHKPLPSDLVG